MKDLKKIYAVERILGLIYYDSEALTELLDYCNVDNPKQVIDSFYETDKFKVLSFDPDRQEIKKIELKDTGEILEVGMNVRHKPTGKILYNINFNRFLFGSYEGDFYYKHNIISEEMLYELDEIELLDSDKQTEINEEDGYAVVNGVKYKLTKIEE